MDDLSRELSRKRREFNTNSLLIDRVRFQKPGWTLNKYAIDKMIVVIQEMEESIVAMLEEANKYEQKIYLPRFIDGENVEDTILCALSGTNAVSAAFEPDKNFSINIGTFMTARDELNLVLKCADEFNASSGLLELLFLEQNWKCDQNTLKNVMQCLERMLKLLVEIEKRCRERLMIEPPLININDPDRFLSDMKESLTRRVSSQKRFKMSVN